jgi:hypothetical protein
MHIVRDLKNAARQACMAVALHAGHKRGRLRQRRKLLAGAGKLLAVAWGRPENMPDAFL